MRYDSLRWLLVEVYNAMNKEYDELKEIGGTVIKITAENSGSLNPIQQETVLEKEEAEKRQGHE